VAAAADTVLMMRDGRILDNNRQRDWIGRTGHDHRVALDVQDQVTALSVSDTVLVEPSTGRGHAAWSYLIAVACLALVVVSQVAKPHVGHRALWIVCALVIFVGSRRVSRR